MSKNISKARQEQRLRANSVRAPRTMAWISLFWGILYGILMLCVIFSESFLAEFSKTFNWAIAALMCFGTVVFVLPYFLFPVYLSSYYPKTKASFMVSLVVALLGGRYVLYALLYEYLYDNSNADIISWKTAFWGIALAAVMVYIFVITKLLKGRMKGVAVYFGIFASLVPAVVLAVGIVYGAYVQSGGNMGEAVGSAFLSLFLLCGEVLLHIALFMFCKKGSIPDMISENSK